MVMEKQAEMRGLMAQRGSEEEGEKGGGDEIHSVVGRHAIVSGGMPERGVPGPSLPKASPSKMCVCVCVLRSHVSPCPPS